MSTIASRAVTRPNPRLLAAFAVGAAGLAITGGGVYAALNATASNTTAQNATSGVLSLTMANGAGFSQPVSNLAPGDTVNRYVTLTQGATLDGKDLSLAVSATTPTLLTTDATKGIRVTVTQCVGGDWTVTGAGACTGSGATTSTLATSVPLSTITSASPAVLASTVAAGSTLKLQIALTLPDTDETTVNGVPPTGTIQGLSTALTWTFGETQRTATTSGS